MWLLKLATDGVNMATIKLTKTAVDSATPKSKDYELRDTAIPGFLLKVTPTGRKVFMIQYRTNAGERRKPAIGRFGEITVEQARSIAQDWLAEVRRGKDPSAEKSAARQAAKGAAGFQGSARERQPSYLPRLTSGRAARGRKRSTAAIPPPLLQAQRGSTVRPS